MNDFWLDFASVFSQFFGSFATFIGIISGILAVSWVVYKWWKEKHRVDQHEAMQDWAINQTRIEHGKKPILFDTKESHVITIREAESRIELNVLHSPNKALKRIMKETVKMYNEEEQIRLLKKRITKLKEKDLRKQIRVKRKKLLREIDEKKKQHKKELKNLQKINKKLEKEKSKIQKKNK